MRVSGCNCHGSQIQHRNLVGRIGWGKSGRCRTDCGPHKISGFMHLAGQVHTQTFNFISPVCAKPKAKGALACPSGILCPHGHLVTLPPDSSILTIGGSLKSRCNSVPQLCLPINLDLQVHCSDIDIYVSEYSAPAAEL